MVMSVAVTRRAQGLPSHTHARHTVTEYTAPHSSVDVSRSSYTMLLLSCSPNYRAPLASHPRAHACSCTTTTTSTSLETHDKSGRKRSLPLMIPLSLPWSMMGKCRMLCSKKRSMISVAGDESEALIV